MFKNKIEAESAYIGLIKDHEQKYCPVVNGDCKGTKCHAFYGGRVYDYNAASYGKPKETVYGINNPCCTSPLVTGIIEYQEP